MRSIQLGSLQVGQQSLVHIIALITSQYLTDRKKWKYIFKHRYCHLPCGETVRKLKCREKKQHMLLYCHSVHGELPCCGIAPGHIMWCLRWLWPVFLRLLPLHGGSNRGTKQHATLLSLYRLCALVQKLSWQRFFFLQRFYDYRPVQWFIKEETWP